MPRPKKSNRNDGRYEIKRVVGYDGEGKAIKKSFYGSSRDDALQHYVNYISEAKKKQAEKKQMDFVSWTEKWLHVYKEPDVKATTFQTTYLRPCQNHIIPYFQGRILQDITQMDVKRFLNELASATSQSYLDKVCLCLKGIFEAAIDNDLIIKNPCRNITCKSKVSKKKKRTYDKDSVDILCASDHKYSLYVHILLRMGLRASELCGLRWEDIDFKNKTMLVTQSLTFERGQIYIDKPKSENSVRKLQIPDDLMVRLEEEKGEGYIATINGHHIIPNHFAKRQLEVFYNYMNVPSEQRLSTHELRHTCGTLLYEKTKDIYFVSRYLGHSDIGITTKTYVHSEMQQEKVHITFEAQKNTKTSSKLRQI